MSGLFGGGDDDALRDQMAQQQDQQRKILNQERAQQEQQKAQLRDQEIAALRGRFGGMQDDSPAPQPDAQDADTPSSTQDLFQRLTGRLSDFV